MAPTGGAVSAPGMKGKNRNKSKSVCCLLASPAPPAATASQAPRSRSKSSASQSISSSCESPVTEASVSVMGSSAPNVDTSCTDSGTGPPGAPETTTTPINVDNDDLEDVEDEEQARLSGKRSKKCTSWVWNYFTKKKEYIEVEGKQTEEIWGY